MVVAVVGSLILVAALAGTVANIRGLNQNGALHPTSRDRLGSLWRCWMWSVLGASAILTSLPLTPTIRLEVVVTWILLGIIPTAWLVFYQFETRLGVWTRRLTQALRERAKYGHLTPEPHHAALRPPRGLWVRFIAVSMLVFIVISLFGTYQRGEPYFARSLGAFVLTFGLVVTLCIVPLVVAVGCITWILCKRFSISTVLAGVGKSVGAYSAAGLLSAVVVASLEPLSLHVDAAVNGRESTVVTGDFSLLAALVVGPAVGAVMGLLIGTVREISGVATLVPTPTATTWRGLLITDLCRTLAIPLGVTVLAYIAFAGPVWGPEAVGARVTQELAHWVASGASAEALTAQGVGLDTFRKALEAELSDAIPSRSWLTAGTGVACLVGSAHHTWRVPREVRPGAKGRDASIIG